jgi:hypothetical protein
MVWYHNISCHLLCIICLHEERIDEPSPNKRIYLSRCDRSWEKLFTIKHQKNQVVHLRARRCGTRKLWNHETCWNTPRQSDVQGFHQAANRWRLVLMCETPENILEQWIHLNQLVRRTHNLDKNQKTILSRLMLHPSRYRVIWFQCGSFILKQLRLREVCLRCYYFRH